MLNLRKARVPDPVCVPAQSVTQSCLTLCDPMDYSHDPMDCSFSVNRISLQERWRRLPCPSPGDLPDSGTKPASPTSSAMAGRFFTTEPLGLRSSLTVGGIQASCNPRALSLQLKPSMAEILVKDNT